MKQSWSKNEIRFKEKKKVFWITKEPIIATPHKIFLFLKSEFFDLEGNINNKRNKNNIIISET
jgi:hypothetical protein